MQTILFIFLFEGYYVRHILIRSPIVPATASLLCTNCVPIVLIPQIDDISEGWLAAIVI